MRGLALILLAASLGCDGCRDRSAQPPVRYSEGQAQIKEATAPQPGIVLGNFKLTANAITDGDTIRVEGLDESLRLLCIDTEEIFRDKADLRAASANFKKYLEQKRGDSPRPVKTGTPMGMEAKKYAKKFFNDVKVVRLERDEANEIRGRYGRYLTYVFAQKNGTWVNYNVECVRSGMSPYFMKYGYSQRFHDEFVKAEQEARAAKIGIWNGSTENYGDYDERKAWWIARADFVEAFDERAAEREDYINLTDWDSIQRIEASLGREVTVLATVGDIHPLGKNLMRVRLSRREFQDFPVIFFNREVFKASGIGDYKREFVTVRGLVAEFKRGSHRELQIEVRRPSQVKLSKLPL